MLVFFFFFLLFSSALKIQHSFHMPPALFTQRNELFRLRHLVLEPLDILAQHPADADPGRQWIMVQDAAAHVGGQV